MVGSLKETEGGKEEVTFFEKKVTKKTFVFPGF